MGESTCELGRAFGELADHLPDEPSSHPHFVFHAGVLPVPPASFSTDRILFRKLHHDYNGWYRADSLWMYLSQRKCRELGIFLLATGFHGPIKETVLLITHPESAVRRIIIRASELNLEDPPVGLSMAPFALRYCPAETTRYPWMYENATRDLPVLALSNADDCIGPRDEDWSTRDTIWMEASSGMFRLAELLLNAGRSSNPVREYALEGDAGYRGVGPMSAELRIFLPGSDGWIYDSDDVPTPE